jgi:hypothetical protein
VDVEVKLWKRRKTRWKLFAKDIIAKARWKQHQVVGFHQFPQPLRDQLESILATPDSVHSISAKIKYLTLVVKGFYDELGQVEEDKGPMTVGKVHDTLAMLTPRAWRVVDKIESNPDLVTALPMAVTVCVSEFKSVGERTAFAQSILDSQTGGNSTLVNNLHLLNMKYMPILSIPWHKREANIWPRDLLGFPTDLHRGQSFRIVNDNCTYICVGVLFSHVHKKYCIYYNDSRIEVAPTCGLYDNDIKHTHLESLSYIITPL